MFHVILFFLASFLMFHGFSGEMTIYIIYHFIPCTDYHFFFSFLLSGTKINRLIEATHLHTKNNAYVSQQRHNETKEIQNKTES